jgi:plastocyanin
MKTLTIILCTIFLFAGCKSESPCRVYEYQSSCGDPNVDPETPWSPTSGPTSDLPFLQVVNESAAAIVNMTPSLKFEPKKIMIKTGDTVLWKNTSSMPHTVTADPKLADKSADVKLPRGAQPFDSGNIMPGQSWSHEFTIPGKYRYFCLPHEKNKMLGEVTVEE